MLRKNLKYNLKNNYIIKASSLSLILQVLAVIIGFYLIKVQLNYFGLKTYGIWVSSLSVFNVILIFDPGRANALRNYIITHGIKQSGFVFLNTFKYYLKISLLLILIFSIYHAYNISFNKDLTLSIILLAVPFLFFTKLINSILLGIHKPYYIYTINIISLSLQFLLWNFFSVFINSTYAIISIHVFIPVIINFIAFIFIYTKFENFELIDLNNFKIEGINFFISQLLLVVFAYGNLWFVYIFNSKINNDFGLIYKLFLVVYGLIMSMLSPFWSYYRKLITENNIKYLVRTFKLTIYGSIIFSIIWIVILINLNTILNLFKFNFVNETDFLSIGLYFLSIILFQTCYVYLNGKGLNNLIRNKFLSILILISITQIIFQFYFDLNKSFYCQTTIIFTTTIYYVINIFKQLKVF